jgi:DNA-binding CsgD family transcriptional regulator
MGRTLWRCDPVSVSRSTDSSNTAIRDMSRWVRVSSRAPFGEPDAKRSGTGRSGTLLLSETLVSARPQMTQSGDRDGSSRPLPSRGCTCSLTSWRLVGRPELEIRLTRGSIRPMNDGAPLPVVAQAVRLSPRQRQVLSFVAAGLTGCEIARELGISPRTVRMHCDALRIKMGVPRRRLIPAAYRALTGEDPLLELGSVPARSQDTDGRAFSD